MPSTSSRTNHRKKEKKKKKKNKNEHKERSRIGTRSISEVIHNNVSHLDTFMRMIRKCFNWLQRCDFSTHTQGETCK